MNVPTVQRVWDSVPTSIRVPNSKMDEVLDGIRIGDIIQSAIYDRHCLIQGVSRIEEYIDRVTFEAQYTVYLDVLWLTDVTKLEAGLSDEVAISRHNRRMWTRVA